MESRDLVLAGGVSLIVGAVAFVAVFTYLAISRLSPSYGEGLMKIAETRSGTPTKARVRKRRSNAR